MALLPKQPKIDVRDMILQEYMEKNPEVNPKEDLLASRNMKREKNMLLTIDDLRKIKKENPHAVPYYKYCSENRDVYKKMFEVLDNEMKLEIFGDSAGVLKALELIRGIDGIDWHLENK